MTLCHKLVRLLKNVYSAIKRFCQCAFSLTTNYAKKTVNKIFEQYTKLGKILHWNIYTLIIAYLFIAFFAVEEYIYDLWKDWVAGYMADVYNLLGNNIILNYATFVGLSCIIIHLLNKRFKNIYVSINEIIITVFLLVIVYRFDLWIYLDIAWGIDYKYLLYLGFTLYLLILCKKVVYLYRNYERGDINPLGFAAETSRENMLDIGWGDYASSLVTRLLNTDLSRGVFSVGISGSWGSGKTSFLENVESLLEEKAFVVKFNPWNSQSSNQIITDYFNTLKEALSPFYSKLSQPINQYANLLAELEVENWTTKFTKHFLSQQANDLGTLKRNVEDCIIAFDKPIIVLIDDLDRLEREEVFEVLRLIRNTAQFKNMIYVVAYDKQHVIEMLTSGGVQSSRLYIEKIFGLEISLPNYESYILPQLLEKELKEMLPELEGNFEILRKQIYSQIESQYIIIHFLKNFRGVKRFVNLFVSDLSSLLVLNNRQDVDLANFFWLELIHYANYGLYQVLKDRPEAILSIKSVSTPNRYYLGQKDDSHVDRSYDLESFVTKLKSIGCDEGELNKYLFKILTRLFENERFSLGRNAVCYLENYQKYFSFRVMKYQVASSDFSSMLAKVDLIDDKIRTWSQSGKNNSLTFMFDLFQTLPLDLEKAKLFLFALLTWGKYGNGLRMTSVISEKMEKSAFRRELHSELSIFIKNNLSLIIENTLNRGEIASILGNMYAIEYVDWEDGEDVRSKNSLLTNEEIIELARKNFRYFISQNAEVKPLDIINKKSKLYELVRNSYAWTYVTPNDDIDGVNLVFDDVMSLFRDNRDSNFRQIIEFFSTPTDPDYNEMDYDPLDTLYSKILPLFGSLKNYKKLILECVNIEDEAKLRYFESIGISNVSIE